MEEVKCKINIFLSATDNYNNKCLLSVAPRCGKYLHIEVCPFQHLAQIGLNDFLLFVG